MFKCMNGSAPVYLSDQFCRVSDVHYYNTRTVANNYLYILPVRTEYMKRSFSYCGPKLRNMLPNSLRNNENIDMFKKDLKFWIKESY